MLLGNTDIQNLKRLPEKDFWNIQPTIVIRKMIYGTEGGKKMIEVL